MPSSFVRELLDYRVLEALGWSDTRDMLADGTTKGSIERQPIHDVSDGTIDVNHAMRLWRPPHFARTSPTAAPQ